MKKFLTILAASSAILMSLSSCQAVLDTITNSPIFFVPETMYDGQEFQITRLSTCKYKWSVNSDCFTIKEITIGNDPHIAIGTADLTPNAGKYKEVTITAVNPDKADEKPVEHRVAIQPWVLKIYQDGEEVQPSALKANVAYQVRVVGTPKDLKSGLLKNKSEYSSFEWATTKGTLSDPAEPDESMMSKNFTCPAAVTVRIQATLGNKTNFIDVVVK